MATSEVRDEPEPDPLLRGEPLCLYLEEMLLELADLAADGGETSLAATLAIAAIQARGARQIAALHHRSVVAADQAAGQQLGAAR